MNRGRINEIQTYYNSPCCYYHVTNQHQFCCLTAFYKVSIESTLYKITVEVAGLPENE